MTENSARTIELHEFPDRPALAGALAERVAGILAGAIAARGHAMLAVSGGSTPKDFFRALSQRRPDWPEVTITLVDERFVPPEDERSNHRLVETYLLREAAEAANFVPLYQRVDDVDAAAALAAGKIDTLPVPFDAVILGMGGDGHTASFFPGGNHLDDAIDLAATRSIISMEAPNAEEPRLTMTLPHIVGARFLALHIEGAGKMETLNRAIGAGPAEDMPIRAVIDNATKPLDVYWAA